jgi:hypothetical protein
MLGRRRIRAMGGWCSSPPAFRALARGEALRLLPQPRVVPSAAGAPFTPRRLQALGSRVVAWPQRRCSGTPTGKVVERQRLRWRRRSRLRWRISCCRASAPVPVVLAHGRAARRQPNDACCDCRSPCGAPLHRSACADYQSRGSASTSSS